MTQKNMTFAERLEIDPVFKESMEFRFGILNVPIQTQVEVSRLPRTMDVLVTLESAANNPSCDL